VSKTRLGLAAAGAALLIVGGYLIWFFATAAQSSSRLRARAAGVAMDSITIELLAEEVTRPVTVTQIEIARVRAEAVGMGPPKGFEEAPATLPSDEQRRFVGALTLPPGGVAKLVIPMTRPHELHGELRLRYEIPIGLGKSGGLWSIRLANLLPGHEH
jgi:hypothetical protein